MILTKHPMFVYDNSMTARGVPRMKTFIMIAVVLVIDLAWYAFMGWLREEEWPHEAPYDPDEYDWDAWDEEDEEDDRYDDAG